MSNHAGEIEGGVKRLEGKLEASCQHLADMLGDLLESSGSISKNACLEDQEPADCVIVSDKLVEEIQKTKASGLPEDDSVLTTPSAHVLPTTVGVQEGLHALMNVAAGEGDALDDMNVEEGRMMLSCHRC